MFEYEDIQELVGGVWTTVFGTEVQRTETAQELPMKCAVGISGAWNGSLTLEFSYTDAEKAASRMLEVKPEELVAEDVADAVGELANILGGNLKALLPQPATLSLPHTVEQDRPEGERHEFRFAFDWEGNSFAVSIAGRAEEKRSD